MDQREYLVKMALRLGPSLLVILSFAAIMAGVIFHAISIDELRYSSPPASHFQPGVIIGDQPNDLVWFLQVTDLHLSVRGPPDREQDFFEFSRDYLDIIKPDVVLVTGDITDGREKNASLSTGPQEEEWIAYNRSVTNSGALHKTKLWLDIKGNHDNFNVFRPKDPNTLYRQYSIQGPHYERNYMKILEKDGKNYSFFGVDQVQTPGLKIPFNFIGLVDDQDLSELKAFKEAAKQMNSQYTVWFAHYPTSSVASPHESLRNIIDGPYLCGHYHTIGNLVTQMHATQQPGYAEIELGDWKYNRRIRLASIDHQLFNFVDIGFREFPIALMTSPKKAEYTMPKYEPVNRMSKSTHFRVIAFSNATIKTVDISIDGGPRQAMKLVTDNSPLYVLPMNPQNYLSGYHTADISVEDSNGSKRTYTQSFSFDGSKGDFTTPAKMLIRATFRNIVMTMFFCVVTICALPLIILRLIVCQHHQTGIKRHYTGTFVYNLHLLCNIKRLFLPIVIIPLWMSVGPLFVGYMVDQALGVCFVWGILIDGRFIHTGLTFNASSIFLTFVHIPQVILLTYQVSNCCQSLKHSNVPAKVLNLKFFIYILLTTLQLSMGSILYGAYGLLSALTSFPFLGCVLVYAYCWYQCANLQQVDFKMINISDSEEQRALTCTKTRDDRSNNSDQSSF